MNRNFIDFLKEAKAGDDQSIQAIIQLYSPLLFNVATVDQRFDEDLYQELVITLLACIKTFDPS